jgi:mRNA interferase RelE/StbE
VTYDVKWNRKAKKTLDKLHPSIQQRIWTGVDRLKEEAKRMKKMSRPGEEYCARVGDYRIIFEVAEDTIVIQEIGHRREVYKD